MATRLKHMLFVFLLVTLSSGVLGCDPGYHHRWYGEPYYGSDWGHPWYAPWGAYRPYTYRGEHEWHHDHDGWR